MSLSEYYGVANETVVLDELAGQKIAAVFMDDTSIVIVLETGPAFVVSGPQSYWVDGPAEIAGRIAEHTHKIKNEQERLASRLSKLSS